jgi:hypothetical protein
MAKKKKAAAAKRKPVKKVAAKPKLKPKAKRKAHKASSSAPRKKTKKAPASKVKSKKKAAGKLPAELAEIRRKLKIDPPSKGKAAKKQSGKGKGKTAAGGDGGPEIVGWPSASVSNAAARDYPNMKIVPSASPSGHADFVRPVASSPNLSATKTKYGAPAADAADAPPRRNDNLELVTLEPKDVPASDTRAPLRRTAVYEGGRKVADQG